MTMDMELSPPLLPATSPAKRKRKAGAAGAAIDCFACQKKGQTCDRVRPYCGQCLQVGSNCSGYKTVLTWGVGVASRGKLRGKTLPIQKSPDVEQPRSAPRALPRAAAAQSGPKDTAAAGKRKEQNGTAQQAQIKRARTETVSDYGTDTFTFGYPVIQDNDARGPPPQMQSPSYFEPARQTRHSLPEFESMPDGPYGHAQPLYRLHTSLTYANSDEASLSSSTGSTWSSVSANSYPGYVHERHAVYPSHLDEPRFVDPFSESQHGYMSFKAPGQRPILNSYDDHPDVPSHAPRTPSSFGYENHDPLLMMPPRSVEPASPVRESPMTEDTAFSFALTPGQTSWDADFDFPDDMSGVDVMPAVASALVPSIPRSSLDMTHFHLPRRMQFIMSYYDQAICPFLVASDDGTNPYRMHIMKLAMHNEGLQNAMAALVTNNIRMREIEDVSHVKDPSDAGSDLVTSPGFASPEEEHYKAKSIEHLNVQLTSNNKQKASEDAVLATLLILCLFHVCNSGFSKFRTQLAGVQKLLRMRSNTPKSPFVGWVEMFFAWLDVMTSAVNDRETEIRGDSLQLHNLSANLGALEQFSGCDGRLFKLIARLGRLNLLSQNRAVRDMPEVRREPSPRAKRGGQGDFYSSNFDKDLADKASGEMEPKESAPAPRQVFWKEWKDLRSRLWAWQMDAPQSPHDGSPAPHDKNMVGISESFRYSALLYIERLANPELPSSNRNFQDLVEKALFHIEEIGVNSNVTKFMLWPLFITGTEAVQTRHRDLIRDRCIEIKQESGFYNNLSGLKVLERVWRDADGGVGKDSPGACGPFRWRAAMNRVDGEYIVI